MKTRPGTVENRLEKDDADQLKSGPNPASRSRLLFHAKLLLVQIAQSHNTITVVTLVEAMSLFQARFVAPKDCKTAKLYPRSADDRREAPVGAPLQNGLDVPCDVPSGTVDVPFFNPRFWELRLSPFLQQ